MMLSERDFSADELDALDTKGIFLWGGYLRAQISIIGGAETVAFNSLEEITLFLNDKDLFSAWYFGVSKDDYLGWLSTRGFARCSAKTKKGTLCRIPASGINSSVHDWIAKDGGFCTVHKN